MTTGIGQSKYCLPQLFSACLISLCTSLFYFNSIFTIYLFSYTIAVYGNAIKCYFTLCYMYRIRPGIGPMILRIMTYFKT